MVRIMVCSTYGLRWPQPYTLESEAKETALELSLVVDERNKTNA